MANENDLVTRISTHLGHQDRVLAWGPDYALVERRLQDGDELTWHERIAIAPDGETIIRMIGFFSTPAWLTRQRPRLDHRVAVERSYDQVVDAPWPHTTLHASSPPAQGA